ncbi:MAG: SDR family oxidoreductase [Ignavibacteriales bacterium]|nr:SDR family oxidoreductase [Ignavibacteriales bacterium]
MRNVLVTGGTGFIGSNLAAALVQRGCNVRILRRPGSDLRALEGLNVEHAFGDVRDKDSVKSAMKGCDTVFHTAAIVSYWKKERPLMFDVNIGGTRNVVESCIELGIKKFIHTSSIAAVGFPENGTTADETNTFNWDRYDVGYRISKFEAEKEVLRGVARGLNAVMVNPSVVIGERDIHFHGGQLIRDIYRKKIFYSLSGGMNIVYVGDVVRGEILSAECGRSGERYILSGENLTHKEIISTIAEVVGGIKPLFQIPLACVKFVAAVSEGIASGLGRRPWVTRELFVGSHLKYHFSCRKAESELGYTRTPFREAVEKSFAWYRSNKML